jgi:hypothetical protein
LGVVRRHAKDARKRLRATALAPILRRPSALAIRLRLPRFEARFRGRDRGEPRLTPLELGRQLVARLVRPVRRVLGGIGGLGGGEELRSGSATPLSNLVTEFGNSPTKINDLLLLRTEAP